MPRFVQEATSNFNSMLSIYKWTRVLGHVVINTSKKGIRDREIKIEKGQKEIEMIGSIQR